MRYFFLLFVFCASLFADAHILCYHRFDDNKPKFKHTNISSAKFAAQIASLKAQGYKFVSLASIVQDIKAGKPMNDKLIAITVDDAYKSFYEHGLGVLKEHKIPFTLFVYVEGVNNKYKDYMNWEQVKEAGKYGEIAFHSYAHKDLTKLSPADLRNDHVTGMSLFEKNMGYKPKYYAYPFGFYNYEVRESLKNIGFEAIMTVDSGAVDVNSDRFGLERIAIDETTDLGLALKVKGLNLTLDKIPSGKTKLIKGNIKEFNGKTIKLYVNKGDTRTLALTNGNFETTIDMDKINERRKLIFFGEDHRYRVKLLQKD
jgi:poly-beta-1,6-N-acetyl-D-glucosamine N-deacetylase